MKYLFPLILISLISCLNNNQQKSKLTLEEEIEILQESLDSKKAELEKQNMFVINQSRVGSIQIGDWIDRISIKYPNELVKSEQIRTTEEGNTSEPIFILSESGSELFKIKCDFNTTSWKWEDKVGEINIINPKFKTENGIGVNNIISDFLKTYPDAKFFYTYVSDRFWCTTESLENTQFELNYNSFLGNIEDVSGELTQIESKHFKPDGKIIRIRIY